MHSRLVGKTESDLRVFYAGQKLFGDDFSPEEIAEWYRLEENACFEIYDHGKRRMPNNDRLHWACGYRWALEGRPSLGKILGLGSGNGEEFRPIRNLIEHLYIVESAEGYFQNTPSTTYAKARPDGVLNYDDCFFDTQVAIAVLHHIPNVSFVFDELIRTLKPGGILLIKEPVTTLGPWHLPRKPGLAPCERGFPQDWLRKQVARRGLKILRENHFEFAPLRHLRDKGGVDIYNSRFWIFLDQLLCRLSGWNYRYHRIRWHHKLAPSYIFLVCQKLETH